MRVLIIGLGSIAKKHIAAMNMIDPSIEIFALRSNRDSQEHPGVISLFDWKEVREKNFDFIIISNPTSKHAETIKKCMILGKPMFIEKPVFSDLGYEDVIENIKLSNLLTYVACDMRFLDCVRYMYDYMHSNELNHRVNEVNVYCGSYLPEWRPGTDFRKCYSSIPELGGGVHIDLIHDIDYVYWIFGTPIASRSVFSNNSSLGIEAFDYANNCLKYPDFCANIVLNYYRRDPKRTMEILFDDGTWTVDMNANTIISDVGEVIYASQQRGADCYVSQMREFIHLVTSGAHTSINDAEEAYEVLKICLS